eukprot:1833057-Rhodomonas_salina.1
MFACSYSAAAVNSAAISSPSAAPARVSAARPGPCSARDTTERGRKRERKRERESEGDRDRDSDSDSDRDRDRDREACSGAFARRGRAETSGRTTWEHIEEQRASELEPFLLAQRRQRRQRVQGPPLR